MDTSFNIAEKGEFMRDVFGARLGDYVKKDLVDSESLEEFDNMVVEIKKMDEVWRERRKLVWIYRKWKTQNKECMRSDLRSISGLGFLLNSFTTETDIM